MDEAEPVVLTRQSEVLLRQIHPTHVLANGISSQAFTPSPTDDGLLSTRRESVGAKAAYDDFLELGYKSNGSMGISVGEIDALGCRAIDDATPSTPDHASIDMTYSSSDSLKRLAKRLRDHAVKRDWLYQPTE